MTYTDSTPSLLLSPKNTDAPPSFSFSTRGNDTLLTLDGAWIITTLNLIEKELARAIQTISSPLTINADTLEKVDTAGAMLVNAFVQQLSAKGITTNIKVTNEAYKKLFEASIPAVIEQESSSKAPLFIRLLNLQGKSVTEAATFTGHLLAFLGQFVLHLAKYIARPHKMRWTSLAFFIEQTGVRAVPIIALLCFLIGLVVAYMCMDELAKFGAATLTIKLVEVSIFREMGILITAIVVAGRSSSSFTAQIGSMVANEEVDALRSMGLEPFQMLVMPRVLALMITLPMLVFIADIMGVLGGAVAICPVLDISLGNFLTQFYNGSNVWNFFVGFIKAPFCAMIIGLIGCYQGFQATGSSESVGLLTTVSVVQSIFFVICIDAVFAIFFASLGI